MPRDSGDLIICWVDRGVKNHKEVVKLWGRWGMGVCALNFAKKRPMISPINKAIKGVLALVGEMGAMGNGGRISQLRVAPQIIAAKDSVTVGAQKKILVL